GRAHRGGDGRGRLRRGAPRRAGKTRAAAVAGGDPAVPATLRGVCSRPSTTRPPGDALERRATGHQEVTMSTLARAWNRVLVLSVLGGLCGVGSGAALADPVHDACTSISAAEREQLGILEADWVPAGTIDKFWPIELTTRAVSPPAMYPHSYCR